MALVKSPLSLHAVAGNKNPAKTQMTSQRDALKTGFLIEIIISEAPHRREPKSKYSALSTNIKN